MGTVVTKDMHLHVNRQYQAGLRGPSYGYDHEYNNQEYRCRVMAYMTALGLTICHVIIHSTAHADNALLEELADDLLKALHHHRTGRRGSLPADDLPVCWLPVGKLHSALSKHHKANIRKGFARRWSSRSLAYLLSDPGTHSLLPEELQSTVTEVTNCGCL